MPKKEYNKDTLKKELYKDLREWCAKKTNSDTDEIYAERIVNLITKYIDICEKRGRY